jgi:FkbM family methyltransferase
MSQTSTRPALDLSAIDAFAGDLTAMIAARPPEAIRRDLAAGCWIYGGGEYGQQLCAALLDAGYPVLGFIDRRAGAGMDTLLDLPVRHPDDFTAGDAEGKTFVGGVINPLAGPAEIRPFATSLPFGAICLGADLPDALGDEAATFWQGSRAFLLDNIERMKTACALLADQESVDVVVGLQRYRVTGDNAGYPPVDADNMYLPRAFGGFHKAITFVDGGAFIGDSCAFLIDHGVEIDRYVAFEPEGINLKRLTAWAATAPIRETNIVPCGLSDTLRDLTFAGAKGPSSRLVENAPAAAQATTTIRCVAFDDVMPGIEPDFIKLDIEGAEMSALKGMQKTLARARPRLAVCLYHRPQDVWEIPTFVSQFYGRLYIRQHGAFGWDTVLYALPDA